MLDGVHGADATDADGSALNSNIAPPLPWNISSSALHHVVTQPTQTPSGSSAKVARTHELSNNQLFVEFSASATQHTWPENQRHGMESAKPVEHQAPFNAFETTLAPSNSYDLESWASRKDTKSIFDMGFNFVHQLPDAAKPISHATVPSEPWSPNGAIIQSGRYRRHPNRRHRHQHNYRRFIAGDTSSWTASSALLANANNLAFIEGDDHSETDRPSRTPLSLSSSSLFGDSEDNADTEDDSAAVLHWPVKKVALMEGDLVLGGLMMVHSREDTMMCGPIMPQGGVQALEAMLYTLDRINRDGLLPNITIGAHILDDCDRDTYGLEMAVDFIKGIYIFVDNNWQDNKLY